MRALTVVSVLVLSTALAATPLRAEGEPGVTTATWKEPDPPLDLHWHVLALPEYAVELLFSPIGVVVATVERYRLDRRFYDLLRNDAGTVVLTPKLKVGVGDGVGIGGNLSFEQLFGGEEKLELGALWRMNGDYEAGVRYTQSLAAADGRGMDLRVEYEVDQNLPYYGIGNDTDDAKHVLQDSALDASVGFDIVGSGVLSLSGDVRVGLRYAELTNGTDATAPGVGDLESTVEPPRELDETIAFPWFAVALRFDRRDNFGRPTRGYIARLQVSYTQDVSSQDLSAMSAELDFQGFVPLLPDRRVLLLGFGLAGSMRGRGDDEVPTHQLVTLGRKNHLRGYSRARFRDELGWWTTAEYRWPIWEYLDHGIALSPMIFFDAGRVSPDLDGLFERPIHYAGGVGVRGATDHFELLRLQLGMSPEGPQLDFSIGGDL